LLQIKGHQDRMLSSLSIIYVSCLLCHRYNVKSRYVEV